MSKSPLDAGFFLSVRDFFRFAPAVGCAARTGFDAWAGRRVRRHHCRCARRILRPAFRFMRSRDQVVSEFIREGRAAAHGLSRVARMQSGKGLPPAELGRVAVFP